MKTPKEIVKIVLTELKVKKLLRESPEGDMNAFIKDLQSCVSELSSLKEQVEGLITSNVDEEEIQVLTLIKNKVDYISTTINNVVTKTTGNNSVTSTDPVQPVQEAALEEDMGNTNGSVNMSVDNIVKKPDVVKKLESGNLTINAIGDDGKPLTEEVIEEGPKSVLKAKGKNPFEKYIKGAIVTLRGWEDNVMAESYLIEASVAFLLRKDYTDKQLKAAAAKVIQTAHNDDFDYWTLESVEYGTVEEILKSPEVLSEDNKEDFLSGKSSFLMLETTVSQNY